MTEKRKVHWYRANNIGRVDFNSQVMKNNVKKFKYIGISDPDFRNGNLYEAEPVTESLGDFMSIKDETGEWYNYDLEFFEENFIEV